MASTVYRETPAGAPPAPELVAEARELLARGGLCALGTETVYGIAARADHAGALARLRALKGGAGARGFTWHVGSPAVLEHFRELPRLVGRLAGRYWPGPLTLVLKGVPPGLAEAAHEGWIGVRVPAHPSTAGLLEALEFPVVMTSANRAGALPPADARALADAFAGEVELVLDSGRARLGESSSVLRVGPGHFELLREGLVSLADARKAAGLAILFVCTGNTCRSPMAEGLARARLEARLEVGPGGSARFGFDLGSAGLSAARGAPAAEHAHTVLGRRGLDLSTHASCPASPERVDAADHVYALTAGHLEALRLSLPPGRGPRLELLDPEGRDIPDPIGGSLEDYEACARTIEAALEVRVAEWA